MGLVLTIGVKAQAETSTPAPPIQQAAVPLSPWQEGSSRLFLAGRFDAGVIFARPALMAGYGKPHWQWFGVETYALSTNSFFAYYAGTRASLPFVDFTVGLRDTWSFRRSFLTQRDRYDAEDVGRAVDGHARYLAIDEELSGVVPVPAGYAIWGVLGTTVLDVPRNKDLYEEGLRVAMRPPFAVDFRLGYVANLGQDNVAKVGLLTETVVVPNRHGPVFRAGPVASVALTRHMEGIFAFTVVLRSPDTLGILHGPYGVLGVRYRWATGDKKPQFP